MPFHAVAVSGVAAHDLARRMPRELYLTKLQRKRKPNRWQLLEAPARIESRGGCFGVLFQVPMRSRPKKHMRPDTLNGTEEGTLQ